MTQTDDRGREMNDDEIIALERRAFRRGMAMSVPAGGGLAALIVWATASGVLPQQFLDSPWGILSLVVVPSLILLLFIKSVAKSPKEAMSERILRKEIDVHHRRWRWISLILLVMLLFLAHRVNAHLYTHDALPFIFVIDVLIFSGVACFGPGFVKKTYREATNDELTRSLRTRAVRIGYLSLVAMLGGTYLTILYRPALAAVILPWLMAAGVCIPIAYFLILEWRADRDNS